MRAVVAAVSLGAMVASLMGCNTSKNASEPAPLCIPAAKLEGIVNGDKVPATDPLAKKVVMVVTKDGELCTGTPISKDVILTAAHCLAGAAKDSVYAVFSTDLTCESGAASKNIQATNYVVHAGYNSQEAAVDDVALVKLSAPIPNDYEVSEIYDGKGTAGTKVVLTGYGRTQDPDLSDEKKPSTPSGSGFLRYTEKNRKSEVTVSQDKMNLTISQKTSGICQGDSGGPVFFEVDGRLQVAGVNSVVAGPKASICRGSSIAMYTPYYASWIESQLKGLK